MLDAAEYLHLAIHASQSNDHHAALEHLHNCLKVDPENANAIYLLAAEHAELGLFDRAISGMEQALSIDSGLEVASLQLGLLYSREDRIGDATELWTGLKDNTEDESLRLFAEGLILLTEENIEGARSTLLAGIDKNNHNPALNGSIQNIINYLDSVQGVSANETPTNNEPAKEASPESEDDDSGPVFLGAYKDSKVNDDEL